MNRSWRSAGPWRFPTARTIYSIRFGTEWKYLSVRRTALFIEESLYRGMQWAAFEPNEEPMAIRFGSSRNTIAELASKVGRSHRLDAEWTTLEFRQRVPTRRPSGTRSRRAATRPACPRRSYQADLLAPR